MKLETANESGWVIGQAAKAIADRRENGISATPFFQAQRYPARWLRNEKFWIDRYGLDYDKIKKMADIAQTIMHGEDGMLKQQYMASVFIGFLAKQTIF